MTEKSAPREWWSASELAAMDLPEVPDTRQGLWDMADRNGHHAPELEWPKNPGGIWRWRKAKGGGREYRMDVLPVVARTALARRLRKAQPSPDRQASDAAATDRAAAERWAWFDRLTDKRKAEAKRRLDALLAVEDLQMTGRPRDLAMMSVVSAENIGLRTLYKWAELIAGLDRKDWLPALAPRHTGRTAEADCDEAAWDWIEGVYLTLEKRDFSDCYRQLTMVAAEQGWTIPSERTLQRRMDALPKTVKVYRREGLEALKRLYPPQRRDRSDLHALQVVNADGHTCDVFVRWPDDTIDRPTLVGFQDVYSSMILSWRVARSETAATVLLAFGDMVETYGIPEACIFDNGRAFASKKVSGGTPTRFRFKVRDGDMDGVLTQLGVKIHWAEPYHGQSKPIERAWRDLSRQAEKDIRFSGAWTGNKVDAKPENYRSHAVPLDVFEAVMAERIAEHNARAGRRTAVCGGKLSFEAAFRLSYQDALIHKAGPEQSRLWLLAAEGITARSADGSLHFEGNRYWHESLLEYLGKKLVIRFDPDDLHSGLHAYRLDGGYIAHVPCLDDIGVFSREEGNRQRREAKARVKLWKDAGAARVSLEDLVAMLPIPPEIAAPPEARVIRPTSFGNLAVKPQPANDYDQQDEVMASFGRGVRALRLVPENESGADD